MKNLLILTLLAFTISSCNNSTCKLSRCCNPMTEVKASEIPAGVLKSFEAKYPGTIPSKWLRDKKGRYSAEFVRDGKSVTARFDASGNYKDEDSENQGEEFPYDDYDDYWEEGWYD